jgi:hypothetical protein
MASPPQDKKALFKVEKETLSNLALKQLEGTLQGKTVFDAVVLSAADDGTQDIDEGTVALKVRPIDIHEFALPDPCSSLCSNSPELKARLIGMHPTAYSLPISEMQGDALPAFGSTVECYFKDAAPGNNGKQRGLMWRAKSGNVAGNYAFKCFELNSLISDWKAGSLLGARKGQKTRTYIGKKEGYKNQEVANGSLPPALLVKSTNAANNMFFLADVVESFDNLAKAYEARFGKKMTLTYAYRPYSEQVRLKEAEENDNGNAAATPGTSNHGWGLAFDFDTTDNTGINRFKSETYKWMRRKAPRLGWSNPSWARDGHDYPSGEENEKTNDSGQLLSRNDEAHHWEHTSTGIFKK